MGYSAGYLALSHRINLSHRFRLTCFSWTPRSAVWSWWVCVC